MGVLLRLLPLCPLRFTNSSSAATVGEQRPKPCMQSILDDLGCLLRRLEILNSTTFPNSGIMSDPGLDACLGLDHMLI